MALSEIDRNLLDRCLGRKPKAWEDFVDRFMGLVVHVTNHSAQSRSIRLSPEDREDLCAEVFLAIIKDDFAVLRHFRGQCSLATYLTVVARRVVVRDMLSRKSAARLNAGGEPNNHSPNLTPGIASADSSVDPLSDGEQRLNNREEVEKLLELLGGEEAAVVRMYHLEGKSYREISTAVGIAENSVGPTLSRARQKMRQAGTEPTRP